MYLTKQQNLQIISRNEGKIKSYESCCDIRAWSHDVATQDRHLREWMKSDMPFSILPISFLSRFLRTMTCRSRRRVTPKCHPDCKSKVLLESICNSCHAVRGCLEQDDNFDKFFAEEELETSHWPCDRCLEVLKNIKMFWKIITEKIFRLNICKLHEEKQHTCCDSVNSIAKVWQRDLIQQTLFVKNIKPALARTRLTRTTDSNNSSQKTIKSCPPINSIKCSQDKCSTRIPVKVKDFQIPKKTVHCSDTFQKPCNAVRVCDFACNTSLIEKVNEEIDVYQKNVEVLQDRCNVQYKEIDRLQEENSSLKQELNNVYKSGNRKGVCYIDSKCVDNCTIVSHLPKPFECCINDKCTDLEEDIDSEMVITMKNCKNESFKHVSLLQVIHKTNNPLKDDSCSSCQSEDKDPLRILTKVQSRFGAIVQREMSIVNERKKCGKRNDVTASFCKARPCNSDPSCSTLSSRISVPSETKCPL